MSRIAFSRLLARTIAVCLLSAPLLGQAQRRDFAGTYRVTDVVRTTSGVSLILHLTIHNSSGSDIRNGGVVLFGSSRHAQPVDAFDTIKLFPGNRDVTLSHPFIVSALEYERWERGNQPELQFLLPDGRGGTRSEPIDLRRETPAPPTAE